MEEILGFIGAGRVGSGLAFAFHRKGIPISAIIDVDLDRARACARSCRAAHFGDSIEDMDPESSMILMAVPDHEVEAMAEGPLLQNVKRPGQILAHTSGVLTADILSSFRGGNRFVCSLHPCTSIIEGSRLELEGVPFAIEGDTDGCRRLERLIRYSGGQPFFISKNEKIRYHLACTLVSNYMVSLAAVADDVIGGTESIGGIRRFLPLMEQTIKNIEAAGIDPALTGPIIRGDVQTVKTHIDSLSHFDALYKDAYIALGRITLDIAARQGLGELKIRLLKELLRYP